MFLHYLRTALRHSGQSKVITAINLTCLAIGLTCFLAAHWLIVASRTSDSYFPNAGRIHVLTQTTSASGSGVAVERAVSAWTAAEYLKANFPELRVVARASDGTETGESLTPVSAGENNAFVHIRYADPDFLRVFALPFLTGHWQTALLQPNSAVITRQSAQRLFGSVERAVGRTITLRGRYDVTVTGVIDAIRSPSHMASDEIYQFDLLVSMDVYVARGRDDPLRARALTEWTFTDVLTYIVLPQDGSIDAARVVARLQSFANRHIGNGGDRRISFNLRPLSGMSMDTALGAAGLNASLAAGLYLLAGLVLLISCINYANLATAQATLRTKEVGMRRVVGARRGQIVMQHFIESGLAAAVALLLALVAIAFVLIAARTDGSGYIARALLSDANLWMFLFAVWAAVTFAAGAYPALVLSAIRPIRAVNHGHGRSTGRRIPVLLVGAQFVAASFLLTAVLAVSNQNTALRASALEGLQDPVVILRNNIRDSGVDFNRLRTELMLQPHVRAVTGSQRAPWSSGMSAANLTRSSDSNAQPTPSSLEFVNYDFFATIGLGRLAGRTFDRSHAHDELSSARPGPVNVVIDDALARQLGWTSADAAVGQTFYRRNGPASPPTPMYVIGVVENRSLAMQGSRTLFVLDPTQAVLPSVSIDGTAVPAALAEIDAVWRRLAPATPLNRQFADEVWESTYKYLTGMANGLAAIAGLAFLNAILGLVGMSIHVINRRMREIGLRKTLGASVTRVLGLLLKDSSKPVVIGNLIALPLAAVAVNAYLSLFTFRAGLLLLPFITSTVVTVLIAWLAVGVQVSRAARLSPATVLRHE